MGEMGQSNAVVSVLLLAVLFALVWLLTRLEIKQRRIDELERTVAAAKRETDDVERVLDGKSR